MKKDLNWARYTAAVELEKARDQVRVCARAGRATLCDRLRVTAAEHAWNNQQGRVTS